ncbi:MAG: YncE family protein [Bariatricus sp.]
MKEKKHKDTQEMAGRTDNPSKKEKKKRINWKRFRRRLAAFLIVVAIGTGYWYYAWEYRAETEPETELTETNTDPVYTMERYLKTLKRNSTVYEYACDEDEADEEFGTYVVPGLKATRTIQYKKEGTPHVCTSMTPQGLAITEDYVLISAYCRTKEHNSVIYVIDKKTHEYVKEIVLGTRAHVGGMAYDTMNHNLWITGQGSTWAQANAITLKHLESYDFTENYQPIEFDLSYNLYRIQRASFMTYHDGALFVGFFTKDNASIIEKYLINADGTLYEKSDMNLKRTVGVIDPVACAVSMQVISGKVQGMAFYNNKILLTISWGIMPSEVQIFNYSRYGILSSSEAYKTIKFPERLEQIYQDGSSIYALFESAAYSYRMASWNQIDRVIKLNGSRLVY